MSYQQDQSRADEKLRQDGQRGEENENPVCPARRKPPGQDQHDRLRANIETLGTQVGELEAALIPVLQPEAATGPGPTSGGSMKEPGPPISPLGGSLHQAIIQLDGIIARVRSMMDRVDF